MPAFEVRLSPQMCQTLIELGENGRIEWGGQISSALSPEVFYNMRDHVLCRGSQRAGWMEYLLTVEFNSAPDQSRAVMIVDIRNSFQNRYTPVPLTYSGASTPVDNGPGQMFHYFNDGLLHQRQGLNVQQGFQNYVGNGRQADDALAAQMQAHSECARSPTVPTSPFIVGSKWIVANTGMTLDVHSDVSLSSLSNGMLGTLVEVLEHCSDGTTKLTGGDYVYTNTFYRNLRSVPELTFGRFYLVGDSLVRIIEVHTGGVTLQYIIGRNGDGMSLDNAYLNLVPRVDDENYPIGSHWLSRETSQIHVVMEVGDRGVLFSNSGPGFIISDPHLDYIRMTDSLSSIQASQPQPNPGALRQFAETTGVRRALGQVKCGLEFEFHTLNGLRRDQQDIARKGAPLDEARLITDAENYLNADKSLGDIYSWKYFSSARNKQLRELIVSGVTEINEISVPDSRLRELMQDHVLACIEKRREFLIKDLRENQTERYRIRTPSYEDMLGVTWKGLSGYTEMGSDASVTGGEIRTKGGHTISEFLHVCKLLSTNDFGLNEGCSFHIHLSVPGIKHSYGRRFQAEIYAYLLSKWTEMPEGVQKRLVSENGARKWARLVLENGNKRVAVYTHPSGTWEFRLFGNVTKFSEMYKCICLAVGAMRHAYRVKLGLDKSLLMNARLEQVSDALARIELNPSKFFEVLQEILGSTEQIESSAA